MPPPADTTRYKNHRFPGAIISHGVWLYYRFTLSDRDVQELLCERGITVSHEAVRQWCRKFGQDYTHRLRRRRPPPEVVSLCAADNDYRPRPPLLRGVHQPVVRALNEF